MKPIYYRLNEFVLQAIDELPRQGVTELFEDYVKRVFDRATSIVKEAKLAEGSIVEPSNPIDHIQV